MRVRRHPCTGERGVSALLFALLLTAMLTVSAFAVDLGAAYTERRHDQNTADAAVMSGAVEAVLGGGIIDNVVEEVRLKADTTLGKTITPAEWQACQDDEQLYHTARELAVANPVVSPVTDCISFTRTFDEVRVKLPDQKAIGVFGPALGFGDIKVSAAANASIQSATGGLPFVALATATKGDFVCLRTTSAKKPLPLANGNGPGVAATFPPAGTGTPDPCDETAFATASENFGTLKPWRYADCTQQNTDVEVAIAIGLDHPMGVFRYGYYAVPPVDVGHDKWDDYQPRYDGAPFDASTGVAGCQTAYPNTFELDEGLNAGGLSCSLLRNAGELCNGVTPRFQSGEYVEAHDYALLGIDEFDNTPPWYFMRDSTDLASEGFPQACVDVAASRVAPDDPADPGYWDQYDRFEAFTQCLAQWGGPKDPADPGGPKYPENQLFLKEIGGAARFGFVPQVAEESLASIDYVHIEGFLPIYMYRVYVQESGAMCDPNDPRDGAGLKVHDAGVEWSCAQSNKTIDRLASIILACGMVDSTLCNKSTGEPKYAGKDIYEFRLVK